MRKALALPLVLLVLASCKSLPLPDTPEKSLLVIPCDFSVTNITPGPRLTGLTLKVVSTSGSTAGKVIELKIPVGTPWAAFAIDPGTYALTSALVTHSWLEGSGRIGGSWQDTVGVGNGVFVKAQTIQLFASVLHYADRADPNTGWDFRFSQIMLDNDRSAKVLSALKKDSHWAAWEGYQLINFPEE